jgi:beta-carotene 3-hydroxylase
MEPISAIVHHHFGHGWGWTLHRDHHETRRGLQLNDLIPAVFVVITMIAFAVGLANPALRSLTWIATGVTAFGLTYGLVHDVYIHRRIPLLPRHIRLLEPWRRAHLEHHRTGRAPYGVLAPISRRRPGRTAP